jgi:high-affinity iron transporter
MGKNLFSVPIFFIVFRETLEAAIIVSVLLGLVEQIVREDPNHVAPSDSKNDALSDPVLAEDHLIRSRRLIRKLRIQVTFLCNVM